MSSVYVVTDCEFDGPTPGPHSMLSFGSVAVSSEGVLLGEFEAVLSPLDGARRDSDTMAFWQKHPEAWAAATADPAPVPQVIASFVGWIRGLAGEPVFAAHPLALDGPWFDYYLRRFQGRPLLEGPWVADRLFKHPPLCLMSFVAGRSGREQSACDVQHYPTHWLGDVAHTHKAIDDARGYGNLLAMFLRQRTG
jgi:hypothetical protein